MFSRLTVALLTIGLCVAATTARAQPNGAADLVPHPSIQQALAEKTSIEFSNMSLAEAADYFRKRNGLDIQFDYTAMKNANPRIDPSLISITYHLKNIPLHSLLKMILADHNLAYFVRDGVLWITTKDEAERTVIVNLYNVRDLVGRSADTGDTTGFEQLTDVITASIAPQSWSKNGGTGSIQHFNGDGISVLVVAQRYDVQEEVGKLLEQLRMFEEPPLPRP